MPREGHSSWLSIFGGSSWEKDEKTGQYYLYSFLQEQPDLNWRNNEVVEAMIDVIGFWLDDVRMGFELMPFGGVSSIRNFQTILLPPIRDYP